MAKRAIGSTPFDEALTATLTPATPHTRTRKRTRTGRGPGRPPTGLGGAKVSDYQRITLWLPPGVKRQLEHLSRFLGVPQWQVVCEALASLEDGLDRADKTALGRMRQR